MINEAYVFQEQYLGLQVFVYHAIDKFDAESKLVGLVINPDNWIYLCKKTAQYI